MYGERFHRSAAAGTHARAAALGFPDGAAALITDHFLDAELRGAPTHGAERMRWLSGFRDLEPEAHPRLVERNDGLARWDGAGAIGYVALAEVLDHEADAPPDGARLVVVGRCFPTGRLGWFAERVARRGLMCLLVATSTPRIVHPDGGPPLLGTNPFCLALPGDDGPTVVDVSMGRITYGTVLHAAATGALLPEGAARRPDGSAETDPAQVIADRAGIVPIGADQAHKGFALAAVVELLCGALAAPTTTRPSPCSPSPRPTPWPGCAGSSRAAVSPATTVAAGSRTPSGGGR